MTGREASDREEIFVSHAFDEQLVDLGEVRMNYASTGSSDQPALLLIPGQSESWWGYEPAMGLLAERFCVYAVDLRGQGRSTQTPGRYTLDNIGNDLAALQNSSRVMPVGGGYAIVCDGQVIGAIGISGGSLDQDEQAALAALADLGFGTTEDPDAH